MRLQAKIPKLHWQPHDPEKRYRELVWFDGVRLDASLSTKERGLCFVSIKTRFGKGDNSKYLIGIDLTLAEPKDDWIETPMLFEQYKSNCPYSMGSFRFAAHFPHRTIDNLWLMIGIYS
jgi:hypothetical protein